MTKIQLATKAVWNGLMLVVFGGILALFTSIIMEWKPFMAESEIPAFLILCVLLYLVWRLWMNFKWPFRLTGICVIKIEPDSRVFFIQIQRLCYVFAGLILISADFYAIKSIPYLLLGIGPSVQSWFSLLVCGDFSAAIGQVFIAVKRLFYPLGYVLFAVYLLCGANQLIRWQVDLLEHYVKKEPCNE
jgi:hypothetical protein